MTIFVALGERLTALRVQQGLTQRAVARQAQCSTSMVCNSEHGWRRPAPETLHRLAAVFGVAYAELAALAGYEGV